MVACENSDCPIEWFHYPCVGLKEEPVEAWYCSMCRTCDGAAPIASLPSTDDEAESTNPRGTNNEGGETESEHEE